MWGKIKAEMDSKKGTDAQIKYAEKLLEELHGDINIPIYTMSKADLSKLIDQTKKDLGRI